MQVIKRDGRRETVQFDKISRRLCTLRDRPPRLDAIDVPRIAQHACSAMHDMIKTETLDHITAEAAAALATEHPDYSRLAARILISDMHKTTSWDVREVWTTTTVSAGFLDTVHRFADELNAMIRDERDYAFDFFGFKTLCKGYLLPGERPQHMYARVAICIWGDDMARVRETYDALSLHRFTHASPTLFNSGTKTPQLASCYLTGVHTDSLDGIFEAFHKSANVSKYGGGIGFHVSSVRSKGSLIRSTNGVSDGLVPMLKVLNEIANYVNQCFVPDTLVYTLERGALPIQHILAGRDHVLTRDGTFRRVDEVFIRLVANEPVLTIACEHPGARGITCTRVHDIFRIPADDPDAAPSFVRADELRVGDYVGFPIPMPLVTTTTPGTTATKDPGTGAELDPSVFVLPRERRLAYLREVLGSTFDDDDIVYRAPTKQLAIDVRYLCLCLGVLARIDDDGDTVHIPRHPNITSRPSATEDFGFFAREGVLYSRIASIVASDYTGNVFDLGVDGNHNYTTDGGLVHNSGKRKGSVAVYIEPHHADVMSVLDLKRNQGDEHLRARDLFYAMWIPDMFMKRVESNATWSLFDPSTAPGLESCYGDEYEALYTRYEAEGRAVRQIPAQDVFFAMLRSQIETGVPYMVYKDSANRKSNQRNLGTIRCSNLCSEIIEYTAEDEVAVCNIASVALPAFVVENSWIDYAALHETVKIIARNLDKIIDVTFYPIPEASKSNLRHRPIGIGVQGLADVFFALHVPFDSPEAAEINRKIFATIYHAAVETSCDLAEDVGPYETFVGSPASEGRLQFDLWDDATPHPMYDWAALKRRVLASGMRNSLLIAPMPTASTASILGNTEAMEPITSNLYSRNTLAGTFVIVNKHLQRVLLERGLWTPQLKQKIVAAEGSVQHIADVPGDVKAVYKTAYELSMKTLIDMAADRGIYVDQSQSLNMFVAEPTFRKLSSMHFYAWKKGLKTGMYYLRSKAATGATKITVDPYAGECVACSG